MNSNHTPPPTQRTGIGQRISTFRSSRTRIAAFIILAATGIVLNCCCLIIPLWDYSGGW